MVEIKTKEEFNDILESSSEGIIGFKFSAPWCGPCRVLAETLHNLENKLTNIKFVEINVDEADEDFVDEFNIKSVPTIVFYKNKELAGRLMGAVSESTLNEYIENL